MRDMLDDDHAYPLIAWSTQFERIRTDLDDALARQARARGGEPDARPTATACPIRSRSSGTPSTARSRSPPTATRTRRGRRCRCRCRPGRPRSARPSRGSSSRTTRPKSRRRSASRRSTTRCSARSTGSLPRRSSSLRQRACIVIRANRRLFAELATLSDGRRELAQQLITTRESTLQSLSRELHDEVGQVLTAIGSMLGRAETPDARRFASPRPTARDRRDRPGHARQRPQPVAVACTRRSSRSSASTAPSTGISARSKSSWVSP